MAIPALNVTNLYKQFAPLARGKEPFVAVDHINFVLQPGEIVGLLGPNGAGKTTIIQMLLSTLTPTSGSIQYFGKDFFTHRSTCLEQIGFASTYINFPPSVTVQENLRVYGMLYGLRGPELTKRIYSFLEQFEIGFLAHKKTGEISAGQKTRVMLCKAFLAQPNLVLLDEPTASLDPDIAQQVRAFVTQQQKERGIAVLFTSHNMLEVAEVCQRVLVLAQGRIIANDTPKNLAATMGDCILTLTGVSTPEHTATLLHQYGYVTQLTDAKLQITTNHQQVAPLLMLLAQHHISYQGVAIDQPTLEDYFVHIATKYQRKERA